MPYTIEEVKTYQQSVEALTLAILGAIEGLEGKILKHDPDSGHIEAKFPKAILGNVLGDRTQIEMAITSELSKETELVFRIYPIDPVGRKLQFGARKGIPKKVMTWFFAHVDHRLKNGSSLQTKNQI
jgi:hypothetical protein